MRGFLKFVCSTILVLGIPLLIFAAIPRINGYSTVKLQQQLLQQQVYDHISEEIHSRTSSLEAPAPEAEADPQSQLTNLILAQITPAYLQAKTEDLTNQIADWSTGRTTTPPSLSLNDLQEQIKAQSPASQEQLNQILVELKQAQEANGGQLPQVSGDPESQAALEGLLQNGTNVDQLVNGNWTFSLEQPLSSLPLLYKIYFYGLPLGGLLLLLSLIGLILVGTTGQQRLKNVGLVLLVAGIWNGILAAVFHWGVMNWMLRMIPGLSEVGLGTSLVTAIRLSLLNQYATIQIIATASLLILGGLLLLIGHLMNKSAVAPPAKTKPAAPEVTPQTESPTEPSLETKPSSSKSKVATSPATPN